MSSAASQAALQHLKRIKPLDGWSLDVRTTPVFQVRLLRRNVPLTDNFFLDLHCDGSNVVGILTENSKSGQAQGQLLVDDKGVPLGRSVKIVTVTSWKPGASSGPTPNASDTDTSVLSPEANKLLLQYAAYALVALTFMKLLFSTLSGVLVLILPMAYFYGVSTCPSEESFNTKQQLKRVMRGHHLPDSHPDKPKGFLSETLARVQATLATEISTSLGYELTIVPLAGAALVACVRVPTVERDFYWVGANQNWYYICSTSIAPPPAQRPVRRKAE